MAATTKKPASKTTSSASTKKNSAKTSTVKKNTTKKPQGHIDFNFHMDEPAMQAAKEAVKAWSWKESSCGKGGFSYFLGFLGAAIYYIGQATSFGTGLVGILKALIWPLFIVLELLKFLGA